MTFGRFAVSSFSGYNSPRRTKLGLINPAAEEIQFFFSERTGLQRHLHTPENFDIQIMFCSRLNFI
jgi:hypothetical protein